MHNQPGIISNIRESRPIAIAAIACASITAAWSIFLAKVVF